MKFIWSRVINTASITQEYGILSGHDNFQYEWIQEYISYPLIFSCADHILEQTEKPDILLYCMQL